MEDLCQEIALHELHAPPAILNQLLGENLQGAVILMGMTQRSPFQEGEGGFPRDNYHQLLFKCDQMEDGFLMGPPPQPPRLALANPDVGCLINMIELELPLGTPRINTFSGEAMLGKTEVSFEQWYHEVQCIKDHYQESVVQESIVQSLKGTAADMAQYMGPTASVSEILQKLTVIFSTVASFNVFMQNFYKVTQGNHKKVPSFTTRLEGTLNQIWLKCPRRIVDCEVACHLKD